MLSGMCCCCLTPALQIDFYIPGAAAISIKEDVETGKDHGVFLGDGEGYVANFLHKQSEEQLRTLGAVNGQGAVDLDTGAIMLDCDLLESLFSLIGDKGRIVPEKYERFVMRGQGELLRGLPVSAGLPLYPGAVSSGKAGGRFLRGAGTVPEGRSGRSKPLFPEASLPVPGAVYPFWNHAGASAPGDRRDRQL